MAKLNENKYYQNYDPMVTEPWWLAEEVNANECNNLKNGHGTNGSDTTNCDVFQNDLIPALIQEYKSIQRGDIVIAANEDSKCSDGSPLPTLASILSRILRFSQAVACVLCTYDPILINILKSGEYPQILMGQTGSKYPIWRNPSETPTPGSKLPITSGGVWEAIQQAIMSVFHEATDDREWVANGGKLTYDFFTKDPAGLADICEGYWDEDGAGVSGGGSSPISLNLTFNPWSVFGVSPCEYNYGVRMDGARSYSGGNLTNDSAEYDTADRIKALIVPRNRAATGWQVGCNMCGFGSDPAFQDTDEYIAANLNRDIWVRYPSGQGGPLFDYSGGFVDVYNPFQYYSGTWGDCPHPTSNTSPLPGIATMLNGLEYDLLIGFFHPGDDMSMENRFKDTTFAIYKIPLGEITGQTVSLEVDPSLDNFDYDNPQFPTLRQRDDGTWTNIANDGSCPAEGQTALVQNGANGLNQEYVYEDGAWVPMDVMEAPNNYAVIHINYGMYRDEELYWLDVGGVQTWNQMDVSDASIRKRLAALEEIYAQAVLPVDPGTLYMLTTATDLTSAKAVPCTEGKNTIVLITG